MRVAFCAVLAIGVFVGCGAVAGQTAEELVSPCVERPFGIGAWLLHEDIGICLHYWARGKSGLELGAFSGRILGKTLQRLIDTCYLDGYFAFVIAIPIGDLNWQRFNASFGLEVRSHDVPEIVILLEGGISLIHHLYCPWWKCEGCWRLEGFSGIGCVYHLPQGER